MSFPRRRPLISGLILVALIGAAFPAFAAARAADERERSAACPPGYTNDAQRAREERHQRRAGEVEGSGRRCQPRRHPESGAEPAAVNASRTVRQTAPALRVKPGAYAAAAQQRSRDAAQPRALPAAGAAWQTAGSGPLVDDPPDYAEVNTLGLSDLNGRVANFAHDAAGDRLYAAGGEGG